MIMYNGSIKKVNSEKQIDELELVKIKSYLNEAFPISEYNLTIIWHELKQMRAELEISQKIPISDLIDYYFKLITVKQAFNNQISNFVQLNQLYIELITIREMLDLSESVRISEIIDFIQNEDLTKLGIGKNSLLEKLLKLTFLNLSWY
ncbi:hypothetical protein [Candidatus Hodarchaeum mangrovi]